MREILRGLCADSEEGHINNLYNTTFWAMVLKGGLTNTAAEEELKGTVAADKNEILFTRYHINYNSEPEICRKGSIIFRQSAVEQRHVAHTAHQDGGNAGRGSEGVPLSKGQLERERKAREKAEVVVKHVDIIQDDFWTQRPWILGYGPGRQVATLGDGAK